MTSYWTQLATEQFAPSELVPQAVAAERAGFDALNVSDHYQPWWEPGHSGQAWTLLGAIGQATERIAVGTGVTAPVHRYNPAVVAQFVATVEELFPGRAFLGIGSGESLNESPCGMDWPPVASRWNGWRRRSRSSIACSTASASIMTGRFFRTKAAYLHTRGERRPPITCPRSGRSGRRGRALRRRTLDARRPRVGARADRGLQARPATRQGRQAGEIILQTGFSWAEDDDAALEGARVWKATQPEEYFTDDWHDPKAMYEKAERELSDEDFLEQYIVGSDPDAARRADPRDGESRRDRRLPAERIRRGPACARSRTTGSACSRRCAP